LISNQQRYFWSALKQHKYENTEVSLKQKLISSVIGFCKLSI